MRSQRSQSGMAATAARLLVSYSGRVVYGLAGAGCGLLLTGCSVWGPDQTVVAPSGDASLVASISSPVVKADGTMSSTSFILFDCSNDLQYTGPLDITMTSGNTIDVNQVTIRLVDTAVLQPATTNTFSEEELLSAFGSTQIAGGTVKTFRFRTSLRCGRQPPQSVAADIRFVEASGKKNSTTVTAPFLMPCSQRTDRQCLEASTTTERGATW